MMNRAQLTKLLDAMWEDAEPGLEWDGKPDQILDTLTGFEIEVWHTPVGSVRAKRRMGADVYQVVEVTGP